jgi:DNA-binding response OmpR family regulator
MIRSRSATVLNVDNNTIERDAVTQVLRTAKSQVLEAATAELALQLASYGLDLVVLGIGLMDEAGVALCRSASLQP